MMEYLKGKSYPLGATLTPGGVNFAIFSLNASRIELLLFDAIDASQASTVIPLNPDT